MADAITNVTIFHTRGHPPASVEDEFIVDTSQGNAAVMRVAQKLMAIAGGAEGGTVDVRVSSATGVAAAGTIALTQATCTAGDKLIATVPGRGVFVFTAVEGSATAASGEYSIDTDDTAVAVSLKAAINAVSGIRDIMSADNSTGTLTWTSKTIGSWGNSIIWRKEVTTAGCAVITDATNGKDITAKPTLAVTFGSANITADDTISIGARKYTWKASASLDGEITLSTTEATAATNFAAAVNADTTWTGLITAVAVDAVVTLTWEGDPRVGKHIVMDFAEVNSGSVSLGGTAVIGTGEAFTPTSTVTGHSVTKRFGLGAV